MPRIQYEEKNLRPETIDLILWADAIARDYSRRGLSLTVRQLYYQGVSQDKFPNTERSYKRLGDIVSSGRMAGMIDWTLLEDRGRQAYGTAWFGHTMPTIESLIRRARFSRTLDLWVGQPRRIEIWVEKQALEQVAQRAAQNYRAVYIACKGYMSQSEMWSAGYNRLQEYIEAGQSPLILHIGDHDPSGLDMTRDIQERLSMFSGSDIEVRRMALNMEQISSFNPPPNPAKVTDSRFKEYQRKYGDESWELDALRPEILIDLLAAEIDAEIDHELWNEREEEENAAIAEMEEVSDRWEEIDTYLKENPVE